MAYYYFVKKYFEGAISEHDINEAITKNKTRVDLEKVFDKFLSEADLEVEIWASKPPFQFHVMMITQRYGGIL